jgi:hypothetical protein
MHVRHVALVLCLLSISALGQSPAQGSTSLQSPIHGIKIFSSNFDATTQTAKLDFMNDSPSDITAWGYCINTTNRPGDNVAHGGCSAVDALPQVVERQTQEKITNKPITWDCSACDMLHPGEHKVLSVDSSSVPEVNAEIVIRLIVYANGQVESIGNEGLGLQQYIASQRQNALKQHQELAEMGAAILADKSDQHPTATMIESLQRKHPEWTQTIHIFKSPEWRKLKDTEYIPNDERGYLQSFVTEQRMKTDELSKHQIAAVNQ